MNRKLIITYRGKAGMRLSDDGVRLSVIVGLMFVVFSAAVGLMAGDAIVTLFFPRLYEAEDARANFLVSLLGNGLAYLFAIPACAGLIRLVGQIGKGAAPDLRELFCVLSSPARFCRCAFATALPSLRWLAALMLVSVPRLAWELFQAELSPEAAGPVRWGGLAAAVLLLIFTRTYGMLSYLAVVEDLPFRRAWREARAARSEARFGLGLFFSMTGWHLLGFVTVFVTELADTLPVLLTARSLRAADYVANHKSAV